MSAAESPRSPRAWIRHQTDDSHHDSFNCQVLGPAEDGLHCRVGWLQADSLLFRFSIKPLKRRLFADPRHDEVSVRAGLLLPDDNVIAVRDPFFNHRIAADPQREVVLIGESAKVDVLAAFFYCLNW